MRVEAGAATVTLHGHAAENGGHGQEKPTAASDLSYSARARSNGTASNQTKTHFSKRFNSWPKPHSSRVVEIGFRSVVKLYAILSTQLRKSSQMASQLRKPNMINYLRVY